MTSYYNIHDEYGLRHYQLPKVFFTNENYKKMNSDSKIAWAILRDRFSLSAKNGWYDDMGNIYFIFTNEELRDLIGISEGKLYKVKQELIKNGLLEQKQMGLNKPNRLYLRKPTVTTEDIYKIEEQEKEPVNPYGSTDTQKMRVKTLKKRGSGHSKNEGQDTQKMSTNDTELNNTDLNNTEYSYHHQYLMKAGFTRKQANLISKFALDNKLKHDDDDFHTLVSHLMNYKPNSIEYIAKAYNTLMNQNKSYTVTKGNKNQLNDLKSFWKEQQEKLEKENALTDKQQEHEEVDKLLQELRANSK